MGILDQLGITGFIKLPSGFGSIIFATSLLSGALLIGLCAYLFWWMKVGKYRLIIRENRGDQIGRGFRYTGRKIIINKTPRIRAMKFLGFSPIKDSLPMPELSQLIHIGFKDMIIYEKKGNDYYPAEYHSSQEIECSNCHTLLERENPFLKPMDYKVRQWFVLNWKENAMRFKNKNWLEQYGPLTLFIVGMVILMIMWYGLLNKTESLSGGLTANAQATIELAKAISGFTNPIPPAP